MELLPPVGWADVATKQDLRQEMAATRQDLGAEMTALELRLEAKLERGFRQVLVTVASLMVTGFAATIVVVLAR